MSASPSLNWKSTGNTSIGEHGFAAANAHERIRRAARGVIASSGEDAAARFLPERASCASFMNKK